MAHLNHLTLFVQDRVRAADWYMETLGLELEFEIPEGGTTAVRDPGDFTIFLMERSDLGAEPRCVLYFQVDDVDAEFDRIQRQSVVVAHPPRREAWGYGPELTDPDGHAIRLWDQRSIS
jgi:predicted enzyme related to lactoylglutathione lyase